MATLQKQRNPLTAAIFPTKIATEQQSLMLVKRLLAISVSCITYLRGILPESAYGTRYLDDLCVKILKEDKKCPGSSQLVKWMLGCYDALQKKYLRLIVLAVYTNQEDPQTVTECYQFKFKYTDEGPSMDFRSQQSQSSITCADTKKASILLIRKIYILMQNLGPLPDNVCLTMKLFYYDEVTPPDYQPPGFKEGDCEGMAFEGEPMYLNVGEVPTPFHMLKVKVTTEKDRMERVDKAILKEDASLASVHLQEDQHQKMDEDFVPENKTGGQKNASRKLHPEEPDLICTEEEKTTEEFPSCPISNSKVDHLISKTSELEVTESRTRSGKKFMGNIGAAAAGNTKQRPSKGAEAQKRRSSELEKPVYPLDFSSSQDLSPKRKKISQPKEEF
ncbi:HORMA domain-containing protein 1-like isoform X2 [Thamnophis elegans]|uniref:HORMA domain-containing protein 1-like isoform X2 n=1 Tax=Thamnophis elegans TaxID=35005 RepID=UPI0013790957|nr:HORMA domain-containing protein 1-like isoform X2 [Thamnophis elegans]